MTTESNISSIKGAEFININSISPLISKCEIKVFYLGKNRNGSFIDRTTAEKLANTLPGCPIVGQYVENKEDFNDHGEQIIFDSEGMRKNILTRPYGFVPTDAKVWFMDFEETDDFGNEVIRTYLMTEGYLWTGQFEECQRVVDEGNPQSMELDEKTLEGHWASDEKSGREFFIINDGILSKLCILGEDVEPCFEGASVTAPEVSANFSKDDDVIKTFVKRIHSLYEEVEKLKFTSKEEDEEGGKTEMNEDQTLENVVEDTTPAGENTETAVEPEVETTPESEQATSVDNATDTEFKKNEDDEDKSSDNKENSDDAKTDDKKDDEEEDKDKEKDAKTKNSLGGSEVNIETEFAALQKELAEVKAQFAALVEENKGLVEFKSAVEKKEKEEIINSFTSLTEEDKKDVVMNIDKYSAQDIKKELALIYFERSSAAEKAQGAVETSQSPITTFNLNETDASMPEWLRAIKAASK